MVSSIWDWSDVFSGVVTFDIVFKAEVISANGLSGARWARCEGWSLLTSYFNPLPVSLCSLYEGTDLVEGENLSGLITVVLWWTAPGRLLLIELRTDIEFRTDSDRVIEKSWLFDVSSRWVWLADRLFFWRDGLLTSFYSSFTSTMIWSSRGFVQIFLVLTIF